MRCLHSWAVGLALAAMAGIPPAPALDYPTRPVHWVVGYPAGGTTDILARLVGQYLSDKLGQQFIIDNRAGAGSNIGTEVVVNAPPDGYTLLLVNPANGINATLYEKLPFNFIRDIAPVAGIIRVPNVSSPTKQPLSHVVNHVPAVAPRHHTKIASKTDISVLDPDSAGTIRASFRRRYVQDEFPAAGPTLP